MRFMAFDGANVTMYEWREDRLVLIFSFKVIQKNNPKERFFLEI